MTPIDDARCSTDKRDLAAQRAAPAELGVAPDRIYTDRGLTGANRARPGLDQALGAVRTGDTLVVPKLDRPARSVRDNRSVADALVARGIRLALGASVHDPVDPLRGQQSERSDKHRTEPRRMHDTADCSITTRPSCSPPRRRQPIGLSPDRLAAPRQRLCKGKKMSRRNRRP